MELSDFEQMNELFTRNLWLFYQALAWLVAALSLTSACSKVVVV